MYMNSGNTITGKSQALPKNARNEGIRLLQEGGETMLPTETHNNTMDGLLKLHVPGLPQEDADFLQRYSRRTTLMQK